jgi:hypothetical protein
LVILALFVIVGGASGSVVDKGKIKSTSVGSLAKVDVTEKSGEKVSSFEQELLDNASAMPDHVSPLKKKPRVKIIKTPPLPRLLLAGHGRFLQRHLKSPRFLARRVRT